MTRSRFGLFAMGAVGAALMLGLVVLYQTVKSRPEAVTGRLGADFILTDDTGKPITQAAFKGHPSLLYFGFTRCPEVCPTTLYDVAGWFKTLGPEAKDLHAYFVTVDPERDTVELMHGYVTALSDKITGITGDPKEIEKLIKGWRVYAARVPSDDGDYTMDHTASIFLLDKEANLKGTIAYQENPTIAVSKLMRLLNSAN